MSSIPRITKSDITRWTDETYFQRGQKYYEQGLIYDQRRQDLTLKSKCSGSQAPFYRQEVLFDAKSIVSAECSCPVGTGGRCKHAVALLLTWVNDPDSFEEVESLDVVLEKRSKPELIAIIKQMLEQEPDLETLLDLPLSAEENKPLNLKAIRQQAERAFRGVDYEWGYTREIERELNPLFKLAESYQARSDPQNAAIIYETVIETILENENAALGDEDGRLLGVVHECAEALGVCLTTITNPKTRSKILQVLFSAYKWDTINAGGVGAADCVPDILVAQTTAQERAEIAKWIRSILPKGDSWSDGYHREVLGGFLLDLESDILDDESYLKLCHETGRLNDLLERLLTLKRVKEAEDAAKGAEDYPLFKALDIFVKFKQSDLAEKLVMERFSAPKNPQKKETDDRLIEWLAERLKQRSDWAGSLKLEERLFWNRPDIEGYKKLRKLAKKLGTWDDLRRQIIAEVESKKNPDFLVRICLLEKEFGNALAALETLPTHWGGNSLHIEVAQAAKKQYPQQSIRIFTKEAQRFIDNRNRESYSHAALCLREVRDIYRDLKEEDTWSKFITEIRERYKKLPALQDELKQLKL